MTDKALFEVETQIATIKREMVASTHRIEESINRLTFAVYMLVGILAIIALAIAQAT